MYFLVTAMYPRFLITVDEELKNIPVTVRVGQVRGVVITVMTRGTHLDSCRPSMLLDKQGNLARYLASRPIKLPCELRRLNEPSWGQKNIFPMQVYWKGSSSYKRIRGTRRWNYRECNTWLVSQNAIAGAAPGASRYERHERLVVAKRAGHVRLASQQLFPPNDAFQPDKTSARVEQATKPASHCSAHRLSTPTSESSCRGRLSPSLVRRCGIGSPQTSLIRRRERRG